MNFDPSSNEGYQITFLLAGTACLLSGVYSLYAGNGSSGMYAVGMALISVALVIACIDSLRKGQLTYGMFAFTFATYCAFTSCLEYDTNDLVQYHIICTMPLFFFTAAALAVRNHPLLAAGTLMAFASPLGELLETNLLDVFTLAAGIVFVLYFVGFWKYVFRRSYGSDADVANPSSGFVCIGFSLIMLFSIVSVIDDLVVAPDSLYVVVFCGSILMLIVSFLVLFRVSSYLGSFFLVLSINVLAVSFIAYSENPDPVTIMVSYTPLILLAPQYYRVGYYVLALLSCILFIWGLLMLISDITTPMMAALSVLQACVSAYALWSVWRSSDPRFEPLPLMGASWRDE